MKKPGSYFLELRNHFLGVKILKFFDADPGSVMETVRIRDPRFGMEKSRIRDKHPGSASLVEKCTFGNEKGFVFTVISHSQSCGFRLINCTVKAIFYLGKQVIFIFRVRTLSYE